MQQYLELEKLHYQKKNVEEEYKTRFENPCALIFDLKITPISRGNRQYDKEYQLFYLPIREITLIQEKIFANSKKIMDLYLSLPSIAKISLTNDILLNEILKSIEAEGVYSTKKELYDDMISKKRSRFSGITRKYRKIIDGDVDRIESIEELRKIYDDIFSKDILLDESNILDGKLFRKEAVIVQAKGGMKKIHTGDTSEDEIINHLEKLVEFMNSKEVPFLVKMAVVHYYFGYVHPFYDGNGRFARLLASIYIARKLDFLSALCFSYAVFLNKTKYDKLFLNTSSVKNMGELTFFVKGILEILEIGQQSIIETIIFKKEKLQYAEEVIQKENLSENEKILLNIYTQNHIFSDIEKIPNYKIYDLLKLEEKTISRNKITAATQNLVDRGYLRKISARPLIFELAEKLDI